MMEKDIQHVQSHSVSRQYFSVFIGKYLKGNFLESKQKRPNIQVFLIRSSKSIGIKLWYNGWLDEFSTLNSPIRWDTTSIGSNFSGRRKLDSEPLVCWRFLWKYIDRVRYKPFRAKNSPRSLGNSLNRKCTSHIFLPKKFTLYSWWHNSTDCLDTRFIRAKCLLFICRYAVFKSFFMVNSIIQQVNLVFCIQKKK